MIKKLVRHGNCRALVIDRAILDLIGAAEDTEFTIATRDGRSLTITPVRSAEEERRLAFELAAEDALAKYPEAFERLAAFHAAMEETNSDSDSGSGPQETRRAPLR